MDITSIDKLTPRTPTQQRSRERYELIMQTTESLLEEKPGFELSIYEIADRADIPAPSIYRFFPSSDAIILTLVKRYLDQMQEEIDHQTDPLPDRWQAFYKQKSLIARNFYRKHPLSMKLILGWSLREVKLIDQDTIYKLANSTQRALISNQLIPNIQGLTKHFVISIEISDAIWRLSYERHQDITDFYFAESAKAAIKYLELYLPVNKPPVMTE